jgi:hypothetical protein
MRRLWMLANLVLVGLTSFSCSSGEDGDTSSPTSSRQSTSTSEAATAISTAVPALEDRLGPPRCESGHSVLATGAGDAGAMYYLHAVGTTLTDGRMLVVISDGSDALLIYAFEDACTIDRSFGDHGRSVLHLDTSYAQIWDATVTEDGDVVLTGNAGVDASSGRWLVVRVDADGAFDSTFDEDGWTILPWEGRAEPVVETSSGELLVGGTEGGGCCVKTYVAKLDERGHVIRSYGTGGRAEVPDPFVDSGVGELAVIDDVTVVAVHGGNMGCWGSSVSALDERGRPIDGFQSNFDHAIDGSTDTSTFSLGVFVSHLIERDGAFDLIGTTQESCVGFERNPSETGVIARFLLDGRRDESYGDDGYLRFDARMADEVWTVRAASGSVLLGTSPTIADPGDESALDVFEVGPGGATVHHQATLGGAPTDIVATRDDVFVLTVGDSGVEITAIGAAVAS